MYDYNSSKHVVTFRNGSITDFGYCDNENDVYKYLSVEYDVIRIDESTHFTETMYNFLRTRVRGANKFPKQMKCTTNPGNVGHEFFKSRFIDIAPPLETYTEENPITHTPSTRLFIPSKVTDNKFLMEADPMYLSRLASLPEEQRRAYLDGSWDIYEGQFFPEFSRSVHVIRAADLPKRDKDWRIYFTCDYGLDMFAGYFIACDSHDRAWVLGEIYKPDVIISEAAKLIKQKQTDLGIRKVDEYLAPSDLWNRRQETGKSVADIFRENGIMLHKTSRDRIDGWAAMKEWLHPFVDEQGITTAKLQIADTCVNLIRCIPKLQFDERRPNDAATVPHEITHANDALRYFCVYRSRGNTEKTPMPEELKREEKEYRDFNTNTMFDVYGTSDNTTYSAGYNPMYL